MANLIAKSRIPFSPRGKMFAVREPVALPAVALTIRQDKVVAEIDRIACPRHEMIDMGVGRLKGAVAVETPAPLEVRKGPAEPRRGAPVRCRKETRSDRLFRRQS